MSVAARNLGVCFRSDRQRRQVTPGMAAYRRGVVLRWGLRHVDLDIAEGESVALIGPSGSGKSSLLRAVAGVYPVDEGDLDLEDRVAPLLSTESGLLSALTGRENAQLLGVLAGLTRAESRARLDAVREESRLGEDFDRTVGGYSQGMRARLGFAAAALPNAGVYLLDEVHEAFDHDFRAHLETRLQDVRDGGGVVIAAGHDHGLLARLCDRAVLLEHGRVVADGPFAEVAGAYVSAAR